MEEYYLKFRFWFKDYDPNTIVNLPRLYWQTEATAGEYDVPPCDAGKYMGTGQMHAMKEAHHPLLYLRNALQRMRAQHHIRVQC